MGRRGVIRRDPGTACPGATMVPVAPGPFAIAACIASGADLRRRFAMPRTIPGALKTVLSVPAWGTSFPTAYSGRGRMKTPPRPDA